MDHFAQFKQKQRESWKYFAPLEAVTTSAAARLVRFAGINQGMRVLDAGCGTGVVAITAARAGAQVKALTREAAKDVNNTMHQIFFGQGVTPGEIGTPMVPTQAAISKDLGNVYGREAMREDRGMER